MSVSQMRSVKSLVLMLGLLSAGLALPVAAQTDRVGDPGINAQWHPTPADKVNLPQYCWSQYDEAFAKQSGVKKPVDVCGVYMNHFCPGLVMLYRARDPKHPPQKRRDYMQQAYGGINYTLKWMPPGCPLKPDVDNAKAMADAVSRFVPK